MIRHYLILVWRNITRSLMYFAINLFGLAAGVACVILIFLWVRDELNKDQFHENKGRLFQVMRNVYASDEVGTTPSNSLLLADALKEEFPEVEHTFTTTWGGKSTLSIGDTSVAARGYYVGKDFLNSFTFPLIEGNSESVLKEKNSILISKSLAHKLFKEETDVLGKTIEFDHKESFIVTGIMEDIPSSSSLLFDFILPIEKYVESRSWSLRWNSHSLQTFILLRDNADVTQFNKKIEKFLDSKMVDNNSTLFAFPFSKRYLYNKFENGVQAGGRIEYVELFSIVAGIILLIACINFINLSTARATRKAKDVGIRKTVGANRLSLVLQYMGDSVVITFLAVFLALLVAGLFMPFFNSVTNKQLAINLLDGQLILFIISLIFITGILAGIYPAIYLSGFQPAAVLKGNIAGSVREFFVRKGLVIFQFSISVLLIVSVIVIYRQINFVQSKNLGYNRNQLIKFPIEAKMNENLDTFIDGVRNIPGVINASAIGHNLTGQQNNTDALEWGGKGSEEIVVFECVNGAVGLIETLEVEMKEGNTFTGAPSDTAKIIFNETAIRTMNIQDPIGKRVKLYGRDQEIIGIVKDFNFESLHEPVRPLFFDLQPTGTWNILVRVEAGKEKETIEALEKFYQAFNPGFTFDYRFQNDEYNRLYQPEQRVASLALYFSAMAILISCLGLFGLATFTIERRIKEIGIRKVMGSSVWGIVSLLTSDFSKLVMVAIVIGLSLSYYLLDGWLQRFTFHIDLNWIYFLVAGAMTIIIAWVTVGWQAIKAANANPVSCLKEL